MASLVIATNTTFVVTLGVDDADNLYLGGDDLKRAVVEHIIQTLEDDGVNIIGDLELIEVRTGSNE